MSTIIEVFFITELMNELEGTEGIRAEYLEVIVRRKKLNREGTLDACSVKESVNFSICFDYFIDYQRYTTPPITAWPISKE